MSNGDDVRVVGIARRAAREEVELLRKEHGLLIEEVRAICTERRDIVKEVLNKLHDQAETLARMGERIAALEAIAKRKLLH